MTITIATKSQKSLSSNELMILTSAHIYTNLVHAHTNKDTCTYTYTSKNTQINAHTDMHIHTCTYIHTHARTHTQTNTSIGTIPLRLPSLTLTSVPVRAHDLLYCTAHPTHRHTLDYTRNHCCLAHRVKIPTK